jgi:hypothetical protein
MMQKNTTPLQALLMAVQMCQCDAAGKRYGHQFWRQKSYLLCWLFKNHGRGGTHKIVKNILLTFLIFELGDPKIYMSIR